MRKFELTYDEWAALRSALTCGVKKGLSLNAYKAKMKKQHRRGISDDVYISLQKTFKCHIIDCAKHTRNNLLRDCASLQKLIEKEDVA